jgi:hypothetical protein
MQTIRQASLAATKLLMAAHTAPGCLHTLASLIHHRMSAFGGKADMARHGADPDP